MAQKKKRGTKTKKQVSSGNSRTNSQKTSGLDKVMEYLSDLTVPSIIQAIEEDHADLRRFIDTLKSEDADVVEKREAITPFMELLKSHSSSEEKVVYTKCMKIPELRVQSCEGFVEHGIADYLMERANTVTDHDEWLATVKVLAEIVEHHIKEEERDFLPALRSHFETEERKEMLNSFVNLRQKTQPSYSKDNAGTLGYSH